MAIKFPMKSGDFPWLCHSLPESIDPVSHRNHHRSQGQPWPGRCTTRRVTAIGRPYIFDLCMIGAFVVYDLQYVMNYTYIYNMCIYIYSVHVCVIIYIIMCIYIIMYTYIYICILYIYISLYIHVYSKSSSV